jgi:Tfp pilus assembly protein PilF
MFPQIVGLLAAAYYQTVTSESMSAAPPSPQAVTAERPGISQKDIALSRRAYDLAVYYSMRGDTGRALAAISTALLLDPDYALAYATRASLRSVRGDQRGAIEDASHAIAIDRTLAMAYYNRGVAYGRLRDWGSAAGDYAKAAELDSNLGRGAVLNNLGSALMAQGKLTDAIASFSRAIDQGSMLALSYFNRSLAYERNGQLDNALSDLNAALQFMGKFAEAHHRRAGLHIKKGQDAQALDDLNTALELDPNDLFARADRALLHERLGNAAAAKDDFQRFSERSSEDPRKLDRRRHIFLSDPR